jgi:2-dehydro-3-deoxy-D-arabinonate dehydratase
MMRFLRIAAGDDTYFCGLDEAGVLRPFDSQAGAPGDFLELHGQASQQGLTSGDYARQMLAGVPPLPWRFDDVDVPPARGRPHLLTPFTPSEIWGAAFSYLKSGMSLEDPFMQERLASRPVIFFKATPRYYVAPNDAVGSRADCSAMIPEPELGLIVAEDGVIIGYTIVNDVSSRDLPRENPLYVTYSKMFNRCVSFGPVVVDAAEMPDARQVDVTGRVTRNGRLIWVDTGNTGRMLRSFEELVAAMRAHNPIPRGTLLATGTAVSPPLDMHITEGDLLEVSIRGLGRLRNSVVTV